MHVRDLEGNEYPIQTTTTLDRELNGNQQLSFTIQPSKVNDAFISDITEMWEVIDDTEYKIVYCKQIGHGERLTVDVKAIPLFFDKFDTDRIYDEYNESMTAVEYFNLVFGGTDYNYVLLGQFYSQSWQGLGKGDTRLTLFKNGLNRYKAEFYIQGNTVYLDNQIGRDTQFMYRYRLNASNIVKEIDASKLYTYAKGYGDFASGEEQNANLIREYRSPLADIIGERHAPPIYNGNITTAETMDEQLETLVNESLKISVSATIHDLRKQGYALAQPELGDRVFLIDERIGLKEEVRVQRLVVKKDWQGNVIDLKLTFGSPGIVRRHQSNLQTAITNITRLLEGKVQLPFSVLDNAVAQATEALQNAQTELSFSENGILAIDNDDPNYVVLLNSAGVGVSTDGGGTFENAITGHGINASVINTGTMLADRIAGGILQSLNGDSELNLNDGNWKLGGNAKIQFTDRANDLYYTNMSVYGGLKFDHSLDGEGRPLVALGVSDNGFDVNAPSWNGIRVHSDWVESNIDGVMTNIISKELWLNENPQYDGGGYVFQNSWDGEKFRSFHPINTGLYSYNLGTESNHWMNMYLNGDVFNNTGATRFRHTSSPEQGFYIGTGYDGQQITLRGLGASNFYNLGSDVRRFSYIYLNYQPDVSSDARLKENIHHNQLGLDFINDVETKTFNLINNNPRIEQEPTQFGLLAQQLRETLIKHGVDISNINMLSQNENGMYGVAYTQLIAPIIKSIQELTQRVVDLENGE